MEKITRLVINISKELKRKYDVIMTKQGKTMSEDIRAYIEAKVGKDEKGN